MNDPVSSLIIRQMDFAAARHKVLAHNLANYGASGYAVKGEAFEHKYPNGTKASVSVRGGKVHIESNKANVETGPWASGGSLRAAAHMAIHHVLSAAERE